MWPVVSMFNVQLRRSLSTCPFIRPHHLLPHLDTHMYTLDSPRSQDSFNTMPSIHTSCLNTNAHARHHTRSCQDTTPLMHMCTQAPSQGQAVKCKCRMQLDTLPWYWLGWGSHTGTAQVLNIYIKICIYESTTSNPKAIYYLHYTTRSLWCVLNLNPWSLRVEASCVRIGRGWYVIVEQRHMSRIPNTAKQPFFFRLSVYIWKAL